MLAYIFWHHPRAGVDPDVYASALIAFEATFQKQGHTRAIQSFRVDAVSWFNPGAPSYFDWYETEDSSKLDSIHRDAVTGDCATPHEAIARMTAAGAGSLYRHEWAQCGVNSAQHAVWFSKPKGMTYTVFREKLGVLRVQGNAVLQRFMALGPSPEFCVISQSSVELPVGIVGTYRELTKIGAVTE